MIANASFFLRLLRSTLRLFATAFVECTKREFRFGAALNANDAGEDALRAAVQLLKPIISWIRY